MISAKKVMVSFDKQGNENGFLLLLLFLFVCAQTSAQEQSNESRTEIHYTGLPIPEVLGKGVAELGMPIESYTQLSIGMAKSAYRDFATSPLFYRGMGLDVHVAWVKQSDSKERVFDMGLRFAGLLPSVPKSNFIQPGGQSLLGQLDLHYHRLWKIEVFPSSRYNLKIGGAATVSQYIRGNTALGNNGLGLENISNLMASSQMKLDISRRKRKELDLFIFKPILKPVQRNLRFLLNVGVLNFNYRPGYAYSYEDEIHGLDTSPVSWAFSNYQWSLNGWRVQTQLELMQYLSTGNAVSLAYIWDAVHAPGKHEALQLASHRIQFSLYFHTKKQ